MSKVTNINKHKRKPLQAMTDEEIVDYLLEEEPVTTYTITAEVDQTWFDILGQITQNQEGFVWCEVNASDERVLRIRDNGELFLGDN